MDRHLQQDDDMNRPSAASTEATERPDLRTLAEAIHTGMNTIGCMGAFHSCINRSQHEQSAKIALAALTGASPSEPPAPLHGHNYGGDWIECTDEHPAAPEEERAP